MEKSLSKISSLVSKFTGCYRKQIYIDDDHVACGVCLIAVDTALMYAHEICVWKSEWVNKALIEDMRA